MSTFLHHKRNEGRCRKPLTVVIENVADLQVCDSCEGQSAASPHLHASFEYPKVIGWYSWRNEIRIASLNSSHRPSPQLTPPNPLDSKSSSEYAQRASERLWEAALIKQKKQKGVSASDSHEKRNAALLANFNGKKTVVIFFIKMAQRHVCLDTGKLQRTIWERQFWDISGLGLRWIWSVLKGEAQHTGFLYWTQRGEI